MILELVTAKFLTKILKQYLISKYIKLSPPAWMDDGEIPSVIYGSPIEKSYPNSITNLQFQT